MEYTGENLSECGHHAVANRTRRFPTATTPPWAIGDIETLTSYLCLGWSECSAFSPEVLRRCAPKSERISKEFGLGITEKISDGWITSWASWIWDTSDGTTRVSSPADERIWIWATHLFLEVDREAVEKLIRESSRSIIFLGPLTPIDGVRM